MVSNQENASKLTLKVDKLEKAMVLMFAKHMQSEPSIETRVDNTKYNLISSLPISLSRVEGISSFYNEYEGLNTRMEPLDPLDDSFSPSNPLDIWLDEGERSEPLFKTFKRLEIDNVEIWSLRIHEHSSLSQYQSLVNSQGVVLLAPKKSIMQVVLIPDARSWTSSILLSKEVMQRICNLSNLAFTHGTPPFFHSDEYSGLLVDSSHFKTTGGELIISHF